MRYIFLCCCLWGFSSCEAMKNISLPATPDTEASASPSELTASSGKASYYADKFHGRKTASGQVYDKTKLTAAHKTLPFNTKVEVTNTKNKKKVIVLINDRLPATSTRSIDLSFAAAKQIDMIRDGVVDVSLRILK